jgi:hypothetical protein
MKVPKPKIDVLAPDFVSFTTASIIAVTAASACRLSRPADFATVSTSSDLFTATSCAYGEVP